MSDLPMKIRIRRVAGIDNLQLVLRATTIIAGVNGAGKTSALQAIAAAALAAPLLRGVPNKKAAVGLLHNDADSGSILLEYGVGSTRLIYPEATVERTGQPVEMGSALAIGSKSFMRLLAADRMAAVVDLFNATPTKPDLAAWLASKTDMPKAAVESLWERIETSGWDAVAKSVKEYCTKRRGAWEYITGRKWGSAIILTWCPDTLHRDEDYSLPDTEVSLTEARAALARLSAGASIDEARKAELEQAVIEAEARSEVLAALQAEVAVLNGRMETVATAIEKHVVLQDTSDLPTCPHCAARVSVTRGKDGTINLRAAPAAQTPALIKASKLMAAENEIERQACQQLIEASGLKLLEAHREVSVSDSARKELLRLASLPIVTPERISHARTLCAELEQKAKDISKLTEARAIVADWKFHNDQIGALEPDGVRRDVLIARIGDANKLLGEMSAVASFDDVALSEEAEVTYGGRPFAMLSESEQWRVDLIFAAAFCQREKAKIFLIDRLDILNAQARPGVIHLAKHLGVPTVIGMTAKDAAAVPNLAAHKLGTVVWLTSGSAEAAVAAAS